MRCKTCQQNIYRRMHLMLLCTLQLLLMLVRAQWSHSESYQSIWKVQEDGRGHHSRFLTVIEHGCHDLKILQCDWIRPEGRLGEAQGQSCVSMDGFLVLALMQHLEPGLKVRGTYYPTADGICIRDYIDVTDLVDAHVKALDKAQPSKAGFYNVGTGRGRSVKEFIEECKKATGANVKVDFLAQIPGDYVEVYSDPSKIRDELNWTARHTDLRESLSTA